MKGKTFALTAFIAIVFSSCDDNVSKCDLKRLTETPVLSMVSED